MLTSAKPSMKKATNTTVRKDRSLKTASSIYVLNFEMVLRSYLPFEKILETTTVELIN